MKVAGDLVCAHTFSYLFNAHQMLCTGVCGNSSPFPCAGGHRDPQEAKEKMVAAQLIAIERAQMRARQERK
jgi:hypothetical protein